MAWGILRGHGLRSLLSHRHWRCFSMDDFDALTPGLVRLQIAIPSTNFEHLLKVHRLSSIFLLWVPSIWSFTADTMKEGYWDHHGRSSLHNCSKSYIGWIYTFPNVFPTKLQLFELHYKSFVIGLAGLLISGNYCCLSFRARSIPGVIWTSKCSASPFPVICNGKIQ